MNSYLAIRRLDSQVQLAYRDVIDHTLRMLSEVYCIQSLGYTSVRMRSEVYTVLHVFVCLSICLCIIALSAGLLQSDRYLRLQGIWNKFSYIFNLQFDAVAKWSSVLELRQVWTIFNMAVLLRVWNSAWVYLGLITLQLLALVYALVLHCVRYQT